MTLVWFIWFVSSVAAIHIDLLIEGTKGYEKSPSDVWIISLFGPVALVVVIMHAIEQARVARLKGVQ